MVKVQISIFIFPEIHEIEWVGTYWNGSKGWLRLNSSYIFAEKGFQIVDMYLNLKIVAFSSDFKVRHCFHDTFYPTSFWDTSMLESKFVGDSFGHLSHQHSLFFSG